MARLPKKGGKKTQAKAREASPAKGGKTAESERRAALKPRKRRSISDLTKELNEAREQQTAAADILKIIANSPDDVQPVFDAIAQSAKLLFGAHTAVVTRIVGDMLHLGAFTSGSEAGNKALQRSFPMSLSTSDIHSRVVSSGAIAFRTDIPSEPAVVLGAKDVARAKGYPSILVVPMLHDGVAIGTIVITRRDPGPFGDDQIELLKTFANQAVIAIQNTQLFNETKEALERQTATAEVLQVISRSPGELGLVFQAMLEKATRICDASFGTLFRFDGSAFYLAAEIGTPPKLAEVITRQGPFQPSPGGIVERVLRTKQVNHTADYAADTAPGLAARLGGARSTLGVPMLRDDVLVGVIVIYRQEARPFRDKQIALVQNFAAQAVIAIENARLLKELRQRTDDLSESLEQQTATSEVLKVISSSPGELGSVFQTILSNATRICEAKFGILFLSEGDTFRTVALHGAPPEFAEARRREPVIRRWPGTAGARAAKTRQPVQIADIRAEPDYVNDPQRFAILELGGARTLLIVPMLKEDEPIGQIGIYRQEVRPFTDKQIVLVQGFAAQAVIAVENARLLNELRARTDDLTASLDDLRTAQDRLIQTEKLASLGQLTAGIAHEIKNPLNFVNNFSALSAELTDELNDLLKSATLSDKLRDDVNELTGLLKDNLGKVVQHGRRANSIVKNMLLHSREGSGERRSADINALVGECLNLAYHGARAENAGFSITLKQDLDPEAGALDLYPQEMTRALLNLISNGFYAATRRKVELGDETFEPVLSAATRNLGNAVEIRIRDNGTGIPPQVRQKMFNPFFTTKPTGEGTGLGLSMTHDIVVKQHGGRIDVATESGVFTEFIITLPRDNGTAAGLN